MSEVLMLLADQRDRLERQIDTLQRLVMAHEILGQDRLATTLGAVITELQSGATAMSTVGGIYTAEIVARADANSRGMLTSMLAGVALSGDPTARAAVEALAPVAEADPPFRQAPLAARMPTPFTDSQEKA